MRSRELATWPNGIRLVYRQQFGCGHFVSIWSNEEKPLQFGIATPTGSPLNRELRQRVLEMGCLKCENPAEPLDYKHKGRGGFLKNLVEMV